MSYCTLDDLKKQLSDDDLTSLTDDAGLGRIDENVINQLIADADAEIDSYCASRYSLPFSVVPTMLRKLSVDIALYNLYGRRRGAPEDRLQRYKDAVSFLKSVASGLIQLGGASPIPTEDSDAGPEASTSKDDRLFSMGVTRLSTVGSLDNY